MMGNGEGEVQVSAVTLVSLLECLHGHCDIDEDNYDDSAKAWTGFGKAMDGE
jgi:hypothetical protein